jgi:hypothetical protein
MALEWEKLSVIASVRLPIEYRMSQQQLVLHNQCHLSAIAKGFVV